MATARSELLALVVGLLILAACARPPEAEFTISTSTGQAPLTVQFVNLSKNAQTFQWDFGDGATTTTVTVEEVVTHEYTRSGTHTVTLTAIKDGKPPQTGTATTTVTVAPGPLHHAALEPPTVEAAKDLVLTATARDQFDNPIPGLTYIFRSAAEAGQVDSQGKFTAGTQAGTYEDAVTVEVAQEGVTKSATATVVIEPGPMQSVRIDPAIVTVEVTKEHQFTATAVDAFDNPIPGITFTFRSRDEAGQVDGTGRFVAGTAAGTYEDGVVVEVTQGTVTKGATARVVVEPGLLDHVVLEPTVATVEVTREQAFTATARDRFNNPIPGLTFTFDSAEQTGQVDSQGRFTAGTKAGAYEDGVTVEVTQGTVTKGATADVTIEPGAPFTVVVEPSRVTLDIGAAHRFSFTAFDQFGNEISNASASWKVATVAGNIDASGLFTAGTRAGAFLVAVQVEAVKDATRASGTADVLIQPDYLVVIKVEPSIVVMEQGATQRFTAVGFDRYGNEIPGLESLWEATGGRIERIDHQTAGFTGGVKGNRYEVRASGMFRNNPATGSATVGIRPVWMPTGSMNAARRGHSATLLVDGKVLITGWWPTSAELYDPATGTFTPTGSMLFSHGQGSTATLLPDGRVLVVGGTTAQQSAEIYDPATGGFSPTGNLNVVHSYHTATLLPDGRVLIAAGQDNVGPQTHAVAEVYDPTTGIFRLTGSLILHRAGHTATLLPDGRVLIAGGVQTTTPGFGNEVTIGEIYDPTRGFFRVIGDHGGLPSTAILLETGKVLLVGPRSPQLLFDPITETFIVTGDMTTVRFAASATLLNDGRVLVAGGWIGGLALDPALNSTELYDPGTGTFRVFSSFSTPRLEHTATVLPTGAVLVTGGLSTGGGNELRSAELYYPE